MERGISEIVGRGELAEGGVVVDVYRALRELFCSACGAEIAEGSLFTRRKVKDIGLQIMPICQKCDPFALRTSRKERSALLRALMTEQQGEDAGRESTPVQDGAKEAQPEGAKTLKDEVRRRLGPALDRSRRGRQ